MDGKATVATAMRDKPSPNKNLPVT